MKLFWRIFLSFWIATILMHTLVLWINESYPAGIPHVHSRPFDTQAAQYELKVAVEAYERQGAGAFFAQIRNGALTRDHDIYLFDHSAQLLEKTETIMLPTGRRRSKPSKMAMPND